jgi:hypothetical protein
MTATEIYNNTRPDFIVMAIVAKSRRENRNMTLNEYERILEQSLRGSQLNQRIKFRQLLNR